MLRLIPTIVIAFILVLLFGCTTTQQTGRGEYIVACGAATGWNVCHKQAAQVCHGNYTTIAEDGGFNRKELRVACSSAS